MRYCNNCHRTTAGKRPFCQFCGSSFDIKLCSRQHVSPRSAQFCAECGSDDLSSPHPKVPLLLRPLLWLLGISPGLFLLAAISTALVFFVRRLLSGPNGLLPLMCIIAGLAILFIAWMMLPAFLKRFLGRLFTSPKGRGRRND